MYTPGTMVIEMIEETFNQRFKTGPLIDQRSNFALFDILMNKQTFDYIKLHRLYSKAVQASDANSKLQIDFPAGINPSGNNAGDPGSMIITQRRGRRVGSGPRLGRSERLERRSRANGFGLHR